MLKIGGSGSRSVSNSGSTATTGESGTNRVNWGWRSSSEKPVFVRGYTKSNGTYVACYNRSLPSVCKQTTSTKKSSYAASHYRSSDESICGLLVCLFALVFVLFYFFWVLMPIIVVCSLVYYVASPNRHGSSNNSVDLVGLLICLFALVFIFFYFFF